MKQTEMLMFVLADQLKNVSDTLESLRINGSGNSVEDLKYLIEEAKNSIRTVEDQLKDVV